MSCLPPSNIPMLGCCGAGSACGAAVAISKFVLSPFSPGPPNPSVLQFDPAIYAALVQELRDTEYPAHTPSQLGAFKRVIYFPGLPRTERVQFGTLSYCVLGRWDSFIDSSGYWSSYEVQKMRVCDFGRWCRYSTWEATGVNGAQLIRCELGAGAHEVFSEGFDGVPTPSKQPPNGGTVGSVTRLSVGFFEHPSYDELPCHAPLRPVCCNLAP